jgi:ATP-dependent Clp protease ATP-binding subunit ClpB
LKRVIQRHLQNPLAGLILEGAIKDGDKVKVSASERGLLINGRAVDKAEWPDNVERMASRAKH